MDGVYPSGVPCAFCRKTVIDCDALWSDGLPYHDRCWKLYLANELKKYKHKVDLGNITFAEAKIYQDLQIDYDIARKSPQTIPISSLINHETPRFKGNSSLSIASIERKQLKAQEDRRRISSTYSTFISDGKNDKNLGDKNHPENPRFLVT